MFAEINAKTLSMAIFNFIAISLKKFTNLQIYIFKKN